MRIDTNDNWIEFLNDFKKFQENEKIVLYSHKINKIINQPYYQAYLNIIKDTIKLFKELKISDNIDFAILYMNMLWQGYFSKDKTLFYCNPLINKLLIEGADVMNGKTKCINNARMLTDLYKQNGKFSCLVSLNKSNNCKLDYKLDIKRNILGLEENLKSKNERKERLIKKGLENAIGNHGVCLFYIDNIPVLCDPTSLSFLYINDVLEAKYVGSNVFTQIKPLPTILINDINVFDIYNIFSNIPIIDEKELLMKIKVKYEYIRSLIYENIVLLDDFHSSIYSNIEIVCKTLKK